VPATRILILGGGYVGLYTALGLERRLHARDAEITLVSPESYMTYQPFLPEAAGGNIEPRHVVVPLRPTLKRTKLIFGRVSRIDHERRIACITPLEGGSYDVRYDHVVVALGSVSRVLEVPGLNEHAIGFKSVAEAIYLRNRVLERMEVADSTRDQEVRRRALTFMFVGGGYAGVEALAELEDLARDACRLFTTLSPRDLRWILVEAAPIILPEIGSGLGDYAVNVLRERGVEVRLNTRLESAENGLMKLSTGEAFEADTLVWTTGVKAAPAASAAGFVTDKQGRIDGDEYLRIRGVTNAWTAGDCAAIPDLTTGGICPPTAQHAVRQAARLAANLSATLKGGELKPFIYKNLGAIVSLGRYKGVARVIRFRVRGAPAWFLHRTYHLTRIPTLGRKVRVALDWTVALFFKRDIVQLGSLGRPREAFSQALQDIRSLQPPRERDDPGPREAKG
jgi:NADH dehydrogenase